MRQIIRLTESQLKHMITETIMEVLDEGITIRTLCDRLDNYLSDFGDVHLSRLYSDENNVVVSVNRNVYSTYRDNIVRLMNHYGFEYYDAGANDEYIMMTFKAK